jgi:hypothetical protein
VLSLTITGAFAASQSVGTYSMAPGENLDISCPNALSNANVAANSETVQCANPHKTASACNLQSTSTATPGSVAFCDPLNTPSTNPPTNTRAGQLGGVVWGTAENQGDFPASQIVTVPSACGNGTVDYPNNMEVCNGHLRTTLANIGAGSLAMYVRQPFDFANRTGTIVFDVSDTTDFSPSSGNAQRDAWPELWVTDQPVPDPFSFEGAVNTLPRNGFGIRFSGCTDSQTGAETTCPDGANGTAVDQAAVVTNYSLKDSAFNGPLAYGYYKDILRPGPGQMNHFQVEVSATHIEVYGTNPFSGTWNPAADPLIHLSTIKNFGTLGFTRGLVWLEHVGYNSNQPPPNEPARYHTFVWGNMGFDGPTLPRDLGYDVPNNHVADTFTGEAACTGCPAFDNAYQIPVNGSINETTPNIPAIPSGTPAPPAGALLTFDWIVPTAVPTLKVAVNGHDLSEPWPYPDQGANSWRPIGISVPTADLVAGVNTITFSAGNWHESVDNIDMILLGAGGVVPPSS